MTIEKLEECFKRALNIGVMHMDEVHLVLHYYYKFKKEELDKELPPFEDRRDVGYDGQYD